jgi:Na+-driven multidrug efflux pump
LRKRVISDALVLGWILSAFCLIIFVFGADVMRLLYRDEIYAGHSDVLGLLALAALVAALGIPASLALAAAGRARPVAAVMLFSAGVNTLLVILLLPKWGLLGAAYAVLIGETVGAIGRWLAFWLLVPLEDESGNTAEPSNAWPLQV